MSPEGRISTDDLGIWSDAHGQALARMADFCRGQGGHGIVKEHNGELWFETVLGTGTRFHVELPVNNDSPVADG